MARTAIHTFVSTPPQIAATAIQSLFRNSQTCKGRCVSANCDLHRLFPLFLVIVSCHDNQATPTSVIGADAEALARINETSITTTDLERFIAAQPVSLQPRYAGSRARRDLLQGMIRTELVAQEATRRGYQSRPEVQRLLRQQLVSAFLEQEFPQHDQASEAEIASYQREHENDFLRDEVRIAHGLFHDRSEAQRFVAALRSDRRSQGDRLKADDTFIDLASNLHPRAVVKAAFELDEGNDIGGPIESDAGFHVVRLLERKNNVVPEPARMQTVIKARVQAEKRAKRIEAWVSDLRSRNKVEVFDDRLLAASSTLSPGLHPTPPASQSQQRSRANGP